MEKNPFKKVKMQVIIMMCYFFGTVFSASLFGLDHSAPKKIVRTGVDEISQVLRPNKQFDAPVGPNNSYNSRNRNSFRALLPSNIAEMFEPPKSINKLERNLTTANPIPVQDGGASSSSKNEFVPMNPTEETETTDAYDQNDSFFTLGWSDNGTEYYTTETSEYETTTVEPLNRIGGVPPAIVASILGAG